MDGSDSFLFFLDGVRMPENRQKTRLTLHYGARFIMVLQGFFDSDYRIDGP
jgi:hypothetical protein